MGLITEIDSGTGTNGALICVNTNCKPTDPERYCTACGIPELPSASMKCHPKYCTRCGHELIAFTDADLQGNISRGEEALKTIPVGSKFDIADLFGGNN